MNVLQTGRYIREELMYVVYASPFAPASVVFHSSKPPLLLLRKDFAYPVHFDTYTGDLLIKLHDKNLL